MKASENLTRLTRMPRLTHLPHLRYLTRLTRLTRMSHREAWSVGAWERARPSSSSFVLEVECRHGNEDEDDWRSGASCKVALVSLHL